MNPEWLIGPYRKARGWVQGSEAHERTLELLGTMLARHVADKRAISSLQEVEFRVFSQWGDDGIIQWLTARLPSLPRRFVEFGVEDYTESNTRFLMTNNNWSGLVIDASAANIGRLKRRSWYWRHDLTAVSSFVTRENINPIISDWSPDGEIGLLHIDIDGNDYWIWEAIECTSPGIVIMEYNALFGSERAVTIPYQPDFRRIEAHYSGQYFGASLAALARLAETKGYALIGTNSAGNNAYFLRSNLLGEPFSAMTPAAAYTEPKFRESRDRRKRLQFLPFRERQSLIRGLPVMNVLTGKTEPF